MEEYLKRARELKNKLAALGDPVVDRTLVQIVLNGLPRSYEFVIPSLTYAPVFPTFDIVCSKLITEYHKIQHRNRLLGEDDEALAVSFRNNLHLGSSGFRGRSSRGRGPAYRGRRQNLFHGGPAHGRGSDFTGRGVATRGRSTGGQLRAPHHQETCWVCGKTGHLARECWHRYGQASSSSANLVEGTEADFEANEAELEVAFTEFQDSLYNSEKWYMDSGTSRHVTGEKNHLVSVTSPVGKRTVTTADGERHAVGGSGDVNVKSDCGEIKMTNVMYVPSLKRNLISVGSLTDKGHVIVFTNRKCLVLDNDRNKQIVAQGVRHKGNGLYQLGVSSRKPNFIEANSVEIPTDEANSSAHVKEIKLWHKRYGHLHYKGLTHLAKKGRVKGLPNLESIKEVCPECLAGRQHRAPFPRKSESRAKVPLELVHSDLVGPLPIKSLNGSRYICVFTDDYSRKSLTYFLKTKGEAYEKI